MNTHNDLAVSLSLRNSAQTTQLDQRVSNSTVVQDNHQLSGDYGAPSLERCCIDVTQPSFGLQ